MQKLSPTQPPSPQFAPAHLLKNAALLIFPSTVLILLAVGFPQLSHLTHVRRTPPDVQYASPMQRPLIVYPKPHKTGSTFTASMLGMTVLRAGGRVAPCSMTALLSPSSEYYGMVRHFDLLSCHFSVRRLNVPALLRQQRDVVFVTSIREPRSWFLSAAVWAYEKKMGVVADSKERLRAAIDEALAPRNKTGYSYYRLRGKFLSEYGFTPDVTRSQIAASAGMYSYIIDHATAEQDIKEALVELGYEPSSPSEVRKGVYKVEWYEDYRKEEIAEATGLEALIYQEFSKVRNIRKEKRASWIDPGADPDGDVKVRYSGLRRFENYGA